MQLSNGTGYILFVDDDHALAAMVSKLLPKLGHKVDVQTDSQEALARFQQQPEKYDLVITDHTMPRLCGLDMASEMLQIRPALPVVLCTGFSEEVDEGRAKSVGVRAFAQKPLGIEAIVALIEKSLRR